MKFKSGADIPVGTIVYKKVYYDKYTHREVAAVLTCVVTKPGFCPSYNNGGKCRVREVKVLRAESIGGIQLTETQFYSLYDSSFKYKLGHRTRRNTFNTDIHEVCTDGIHVFLSKSLARKY